MSPLKRFISYYKPHKLLFTLDMIAAFLVAIIGLGYPIITRRMLNNIEAGGEIILTAILGAILIGIYLLRWGLRYFIQYYGHIMGIRMQAQMRSDLFKKIEKLPYTFFDEHETGKIMTRMTNDLFEVAELAHHGPENIFIASFTLIGAITYLSYINWPLALMCVAMIPVLFGISFIFRRKMKEAFKASRVAQASINASVESSITGVRVTKAYTNEDKELEKFEVSNKEFLVARNGALNAMAGYMSTSQFVTDVFNVLILVGGGIFIAMGKLSFPDYSAFIISVNLFIMPVNQLIQFMEQYREGASGFTRFVEILETKEENDSGSYEFDSIEGNISFKNVTFKYEASKGDVLNDVSLDIKPGEKVALVGPTGGGKTTICHLLPRFYELEKGEITIDGHNIQESTLKSLRSHIGIVQQDVFLFAGTIRNNVAYGKLDASDEEINEAIKKANLAEFVSNLPNGVDTEIGERGVKLSGGQKQRISIARVFLKNPSILILDEATSALDNSTEYLIQQALDELCKGRTTIVVAHRLSTIKNASKIFVISGGEIVEQGSHEELIGHEGIYKSLYELQFRED
ncbi:MAG: ABC transporter ATP-binding protein/permease [Bacilli bacterium]|nr:ABC transporter ATP-binding protein/permease [Bacilli bacterium]